MSIRSKVALVTGGAGFIGSHMAEKLIENNYSVIILDNESTGLRKNVPHLAHYEYGDVRDSATIERIFRLGIDVVFHIAGQASNIQSFDDPYSDLETNVIGTVNILQACLKHKTPRLLFASSMTVYGHPSTVPVSENECPRPISYYGITKYAAERYVLATSLRRDLNFEFNVTAFRMFNVYGERQRLDNAYQGVLGYFLGNVFREEPIIIHSDGEQTRDFIHIDDVVNAWVTAVDTPASFQKVYNLGSGSAISINRLVDTVLGANNRTRDNYPIVYGPLRSGDQRHMTADIRDLQKDLGWKPVIDLETGIERTLRWGKNEVGGK